jgi:outer membrane murein-binding lipoprotein Lpp
MFDFLSIKKSVQDLAQQVSQLKQKIEALKRAREDLATAPAARVDIKATVSALLEERAATYAKGFRRQMDAFVRKPDRIGAPGALRQELLMGIPTEAGQISNLFTLEMGLSALLKDAIHNGLMAQIDAMEWPEQGLPMAERKLALEKMDADISTLESDLNALNQAARSAGISIDA